ncbi:hypothetical protein EG68_02923 [Paragonimus skrjabini miyazakii]|uniref:Uncharacterized protein n=1 Tax=Paragonimus skrjabini miyazakii TaxID=59628 RepID=A0A8S9Z2Z5_9TREM|nr:hypothetical protein EG68_02923 [Paragonimus skrjabini miyazakii]
MSMGRIMVIPLQLKQNIFRIYCMLLSVY